MNYRHAYHAGNFADVHKHIVLLALIERLKRKPKPFFYLDTHAGRGMYDLSSAEANRGREWHGGIARLRASSSQAVDVQRYLAAASAQINRDSPGDVHYAGSPILALRCLREPDRAVFVEAQLEEAHALQQSTRGRRGISVVHGDGYAALKTYLPPREKRGLVFIDPPYESDREYAELVDTLTLGLHRWPGGMFVVWYPLKAGGGARRFHSMLQAAELRKLLSLRLHVHPLNSPLGLNGSGILIVNPPWQFDIEMQPVQEELHRALATESAQAPEVEWLVPE